MGEKEPDVSLLSSDLPPISHSPTVMRRIVGESWMIDDWQCND